MFQTLIGRVSLVACLGEVVRRLFVDVCVIFVKEPTNYGNVGVPWLMIVEIDPNALGHTVNALYLGREPSLLPVGEIGLHVTFLSVKCWVLSILGHRLDPNLHF